MHGARGARGDPRTGFRATERAEAAHASTERGSWQPDLVDREPHGLSEATGRRDHSIRALRLAADPEDTVAATEDGCRDGMEDVGVGVVLVVAGCSRGLDEREGEPLAHDGQVAATP